MRTTLCYLAAIVAAHGLGAECWAAPTTIAIGASKDSTIYSNRVDRASGGGNGLFTGTNGQDDPRRALIAFDVAGAVPAGAVIQHVQLTLVLGQLPTGPADTSTVGLHRLVADWGEGTTQQQNPPNDSFGGMGQGAPSLDGDVTWNARFFSATTPTPWATPGGDFVPTASASAAIGLPLNVGYSWDSTAGLMNDVQGWLDDPSSNFGWMLANADETSTSTFRVFYSRHVATEAWRPQLSITYVPEPAGLALCLLAGFALMGMRRSRHCRAPRGLA